MNGYIKPSINFKNATIMKVYLIKKNNGNREELLAIATSEAKAKAMLIEESKEDNFGQKGIEWLDELEFVRNFKDGSSEYVEAEETETDNWLV